MVPHIARTGPTNRARIAIPQARSQTFQRSYWTLSRVSIEMGDGSRVPFSYSAKPPTPTQPGHPSVGWLYWPQTHFLHFELEHGIDLVRLLVTFFVVSNEKCNVFWFRLTRGLIEIIKLPWQRVCACTAPGVIDNRYLSIIFWLWAIVNKQMS